jgi:hypothetical protein
VVAPAFPVPVDSRGTRAATSGLSRFQRQAREIGFACMFRTHGAFGRRQDALRVDLLLELVERSLTGGGGSR